jgi:hypothetical protein
MLVEMLDDYFDVIVLSEIWSTNIEHYMYLIRPETDHSGGKYAAVNKAAIRSINEHTQ